jgi:beta-N-acetylhexosaminidase
MLCIGNNLLDQEQEMAATAEYIVESLHEGILPGSAIEQSIARVGRRKMLLAG